jgi:hypothetical protein
MQALLPGLLDDDDDDDDNAIFQNIGNHSPSGTASQSKRPSSSAVLWEHKISCMV